MLQIYFQNHCWAFTISPFRLWSLEEMPDEPNVAGEYFYEEPDLSRGVKGVDYVIDRADNRGEGWEQQQEE
mgnify:CR=1 FL=1